MSIKSINQIAFDFCSFYFLVSIRPANHILLISTKFLNPSKTVTTEVIRSPYLYPKVQENRNNHINHHQTNRIMNILSSVFNKNMMVGKKKKIIYFQVSGRRTYYLVLLLRYNTWYLYCTYNTVFIILIYLAN